MTSIEFQMQTLLKVRLPALFLMITGGQGSENPTVWRVDSAVLKGELIENSQPTLQAFLLSIIKFLKMINSMHQLLAINSTRDEFVPNKTIRAIEASLLDCTNEKSYCQILVLKNHRSDQSLITRIARLEGFYKGGIECSLSEN
jgi:hypothetical protein